MNRRLYKTRVRFLEDAHHLDADHAAGRSERPIDQQLASKQPKVAIGIASGKAKKHLDNVMVDAAHHLAMERVAASHFVTLNNIDMIDCEGYQ